MPHGNLLQVLTAGRLCSVGQFLRELPGPRVVYLSGTTAASSPVAMNPSSAVQHRVQLHRVRPRECPDRTLVRECGIRGR